MKHYKEFIVEMSEEILDAEVTFTPFDVKTDKNGKVTSLKIRTAFEEGRNSIVMKDKGLERAFIAWYGEEKIKKALEKGGVSSLHKTEVYSSISNKGLDMYIYFDNKKISLKV